MRDIRVDLKERLETLSAELEEKQKEVAELLARQQSLQILLDAEDRQWRIDTSKQPVLFPAMVERDGAIYAAFLREALSDYQPWSLDRLKRLASERGLPFHGKNPGRVLHFALIGMKQTGHVESLANGLWALKREDHKIAALG